MSTTVQLEATMRAELQAAKALADQADAAGRDFTDAERTKVAGHMKAYGAAKAQHERLRNDKAAQKAERDAGDAALRQYLADLGSEIGLEPGGGTGARPSDWRKSSGDWGTKVVDANTDRMGRKSLLQSGSVPVTVPLNPNPVRLGERAQFLRQLIPGVPAPTGRFSFMRQTVRTFNAAPVAAGALKPTVHDHDGPRRRPHPHDRPPVRADPAPGPRRRGHASAVRRGRAALRPGAGTGRPDPERRRQRRGLHRHPQHLRHPDAGVERRRGAHHDPQGGDGAGGGRPDPGRLGVRPGRLGGRGVGRGRRVRRQLEPADSGGPDGPKALGTAGGGHHACPAGTAILGDFRGSSELHLTEEARIDWSEQTYDPNALGAGVGASDFQRNLVRFRAEMRANLAVTRPGAFVEVDVAA
jgi:hypothetical protein